MEKAVLIVLALIALSAASLLVDPPEPAESGWPAGDTAYDSP